MVGSQFDQYFAALEAIKNGQPRASIVDGEPEPGYYRTKRRDGSLVPVTYWLDSKTDELRCQMDGKDIERVLADQVWIWAAKNPIDEELFASYFVNGKWPDQNDAVLKDHLAAGSNSQHAPDPSSFEGIQHRLQDLVVEANRLIAKGAAKSKEEADSAADLANRIAALEKLAESQRKAQKQPHYTAGLEVDALWKPLINLAGANVADVKQKVCSPWLSAENARMAAEVRRRQDELMARERQAAETNTPMPPTTPVNNTYKPATAGTTGRKVAQRSVTIAVITDREAFLAAVRDRPEITAALQAIADAGKANKQPYPGVEYRNDLAAV